MKKITVGIIVLIFGLVAGLVIIFSFKGKAAVTMPAEKQYEILNKWELPDILREVSGIAWMAEDQIACVQDEDGIIFIYNLKTSRIEKTIPFAEGGDYEGITIIKDKAYILRSDGIIFEVAEFTGPNPQVKKFTTEMKQFPGINIEGLCADPMNERLLLAVKERKGIQGQKEIYAFNLKDANSDTTPIVNVDLADPIFREVKGKLKKKFNPGEINIHPQTGDYYILDGSEPKVLIVGKDGKSKELFLLQLKDFQNPEGLTFSPEGDLYISNEAEGASANILKVSLKGK